MKRIIKLLLFCLMIFLIYSTFIDNGLFLNVKEEFKDYSQQINEKQNVTIYYKDTKGYVVPVTIKMDKDQATFDKVLNYMVDNEENGKSALKNGLYPTIMAGSILSIEVDEKTANVGLSEKALEYSSENDEKAFVVSVVYALSEFSGIDSVKFSCEDNEKLTFGSEMNTLFYRENINEIGKDKKSKSKNTMYIAKKCNNVYNYIPYSVYSDKSDLSLQDILISHFNLCNSPSYSSMIFADTANIEDVIVKADSVYVCLSSEFSLMDKSMLNYYKNSVCLTVKENTDDIKKVRFVINQKDEKNGIIETQLINDYSNLQM